MKFLFISSFVVLVNKRPSSTEKFLYTNATSDRTIKADGMIGGEMFEKKLCVQCVQKWASIHCYSVIFVYNSGAQFEPNLPTSGYAESPVILGRA